MVGAVSNTRTGFIIHINQPMTVNYSNQQVNVTGLITLSSSKNVFDFSPISVEGDSGALVFHAETEQPIGMILGGNTQFSFAMPFGTLINAFPSYWSRSPAGRLPLNLQQIRSSTLPSYLP